ncbi:MAG: hypothetical protein NC095_01635 [Muribaculum sp.]|nr:hypothetical protein [Muribaculum sp.]
MSNHFDYMPKPEGWVPPVPENEPAPSMSQPVDADEAELTETASSAVSDNLTQNHDNSEKNEYEDSTSIEKGVTLCSNLLSWIFVPLLMPVYGILLIFNLSILSLASFQTKLFFTLVVLGVNFVFPMATVLMLKKMGLIQDIGLNGRRERLIPYIITIICLGGTAWFLYYKGAPLWVAMFFAGGTLTAIINMTVNFRWKISAHAAGIAGIVAMLIQITKEGFPMPGMTWWIVGSILLAGMLCSARVWLGRHTLPQVLAGSAVGFLCVWSLSLI